MRYRYLVGSVVMVSVDGIIKNGVVESVSDSKIEVNIPKLGVMAFDSKDIY